MVVSDICSSEGGAECSARHGLFAVEFEALQPHVYETGRSCRASGVFVWYIQPACLSLAIAYSLKLLMRRGQQRVRSGACCYGVHIHKVVGLSAKYKRRMKWKLQCKKNKGFHESSFTH